jgi:hypothetical protein
MRLEAPQLSGPGRQAGIESGKQGERRRCGTDVEGLVPRFQRSSFSIILSRPLTDGPMNWQPFGPESHLVSGFMSLCIEAGSVGFRMQYLQPESAVGKIRLIQKSKVLSHVLFYFIGLMDKKGFVAVTGDLIDRIAADLAFVQVIQDFELFIQTQLLVE